MVTENNKKIINASLLFVDVLSELLYEKISDKIKNTIDWDYNYKNDDNEETIALKWLFFYYGLKVLSPATDDVSKLCYLKPLYNFIKSNNNILSENHYNNDWSTYQTDQTIIQTRLKYLLCNLNIESKRVMNCVAGYINVYSPIWP
jgi:ribosomal protein S17E